MLTIDFPDKSVTYDTFVRDVASSVVHTMIPKWSASEKHTLCLGVAMWIDGASRVK